MPDIGTRVLQRAIPAAWALWAANALVHAQQAAPRRRPNGHDTSSRRTRPVCGSHHGRRFAIPGRRPSEAEYDPKGWPRGLSLQLTRNLQTASSGAPGAARNQRRTDTRGIQVDAYLDTPDFGALSIHALAGRPQQHGAECVERAPNGPAFR